MQPSAAAHQPGSVIAARENHTCRGSTLPFVCPRHGYCDSMEHTPETARARLLISGRVQGVWFRGTTRDVAQSLGLEGWVRNLPDGRVEAVFEGPKDKVQQAIAWCHKGPRYARVESVEVNWEQPEGLSGGFRVRF